MIDIAVEMLDMMTSIGIEIKEFRISIYIESAVKEVFGIMHP